MNKKQIELVYVALRETAEFLRILAGEAITLPVARVLPQLRVLVSHAQFVASVCYQAPEVIPAEPAKPRPLTDEQINEAFNQSMAVRPQGASNAETRRLFVRAVEAAQQSQAPITYPEPSSKPMIQDGGDALELLAALRDLCFECDAITGTTAPTVFTYTRVMRVLRKHTGT